MRRRAAKALGGGTLPKRAEDLVAPRPWPCGADPKFWARWEYGWHGVILAAIALRADR